MSRKREFYSSGREENFLRGVPFELSSERCWDWLSRHLESPPGRGKKSSKAQKDKESEYSKNKRKVSVARLSAIGWVSWGCWHRQGPNHLGPADLVKDAGLYILGKWQDKKLLSYSKPKILPKISLFSIISMMLYILYSLLAPWFYCTWPLNRTRTIF